MGIGGHHKFKFNITIPHGCKNPMAKPLYDGVLALAGSVALLLLLILGLCRQRFVSTVFIKFPVMVGNPMCYALVSYTIGLMQSSTFGNELFIVWAVCLVMLLGSADSIAAFSILDSSKWHVFDTQLILQLSWVSLLWVQYFKMDSPIEAPIIILLIFCACKTFFRIVALRWSSGWKDLSLRWRTKLVADYMHSEDEFTSGGPVDPVLMTGYNYIVFGQPKKMPKPEPPNYMLRVDPKSDKIITVDRIWRCQGRLVNSKEGDEFKDICLSYALAKLLCRRFYSYELAEKDLPKTKDLVLRGLLSQDDNPERAFRVIEVELSFIYDLFYTKYPLIFYNLHLTKILSLLQAIPLLWLAVLLLRSYNHRHDYLTLQTGQAKNYHSLVSFVLVIIIFIFEYLQILLYIMSDWVKVSLICYYVSKPTCQTTLFLENIIRFICRLKIFKHYWWHKLGQYSLLDSLHHHPKMNFISNLAYYFVYNKRQSQKQGDSIKLSDTVKKAILHSLRISNGRLSNGKASLERNHAAQLSEAFILGNHAQSILVWHIATTLCMQHTLNQQKKSKGKDDKNGGLAACYFWRTSVSRHINKSIGDYYEIAISLSNYCAYLVAFAPMFLPEQSYDTEVMFDAVVKEANNTLGEEKSSMSRIFDKMMKFAEVAADNGILKKGALLGKKLIEEIEAEEKRWKVLADYWSEMILFIAPSNNTTLHFEKLAEGGELITHLWALLSHAGIVEREAVISTA